MARARIPKSGRALRPLLYPFIHCSNLATTPPAQHQPPSRCLLLVLGAAVYIIPLGRRTLSRKIPYPSITDSPPHAGTISLPPHRAQSPYLHPRPSTTPARPVGYLPPRKYRDPTNTNGLWAYHNANKIIMLPGRAVSSEQRPLPLPRLPFPPTPSASPLSQSLSLSLFSPAHHGVSYGPQLPLHQGHPDFRHRWCWLWRGLP